MIHMVVVVLVYICSLCCVLMLAMVLFAYAHTSVIRQHIYKHVEL